MFSASAFIIKFKRLLVKRDYDRLNSYVINRADFETNNERLLKKLYKLVLDSLKIHDASLAYCAVELIKLAIGKGLYRSDESHYLKGLILHSMRNNEFQICEYILEAYKPLIKKNTDNYEVITRDLAIIVTFAFKYKRNYLITKAIGIIMKISYRGEEMVKMLNTSGVLAIRNQDIDLFRDIACGLNKQEEFDKARILIYWLNRIVKTDNEQILRQWLELADELLRPPNDNKSGLYLIEEWKNIISSAYLNPYCKMRLFIAEQLLFMTDKTLQTELSYIAVEGIAKTVRSAIECRKDEVFILLSPLLNYGKTLLQHELSFPNFNDGFRQKTLYFLLKQLVYFVEQYSRQDFSITPADVIYTIYTNWQNKQDSKFNAKNKKRFCQLLLLYWKDVNRRQAKKIDYYNIDLNEPVLLHSNDIKNLLFLNK